MATKKFIDIWNDDRNAYNAKRTTVLDARARRIPQIYNSDIIDLFRKWDGYLYGVNASIDSTFWTQLKADIKAGKLSISFIIYPKYGDFWVTSETVAKTLDSLGLVPPKSGTDTMKFVIISVALIATLGLLYK